MTSGGYWKDKHDVRKSSQVPRIILRLLDTFIIVKENCSTCVYADTAVAHMLVVVLCIVALAPSTLRHSLLY